MSPQDFTNVFIDGVLMQVHVNYWSGAKNLKPEDLGLKPEDVATAFKLGQKMLVPDEVIRAFRHIEGQARRVVDVKAFDFPLGSAKFVTRTSFTKAVKELTTLQKQYNDLADDLITKYGQYRQEILPVYQEAAETAFLKSTPPLMVGGMDYDREAEKREFIAKFLERINSYYPSVDTLRKRFSLNWDTFQIAAPEMLEVSTESVMESEEERAKAVAQARATMKEKIDSFVGDAVKVLRQKTNEMCSHIASAIKEGKVIRSTTVASLKNFIESFKDMNFVGDQTIASQLDAIQKDLLDAHPENAFADNNELREELERRLNLVVQEAAKVSEEDINNITGGYNRRVQWK